VLRIDRLEKGRGQDAERMVVERTFGFSLEC